MPERIQRKRTRGFRMPENTVYVGRPSKFGNPLPKPFEQAMYRTWLCGSTERAKQVLDGIVHLRGKNLACWCALNQPCHADILLELANAHPYFPQVTEGTETHD
jgi:hypothetical protein